MQDGFIGDNAALIDSITALLSLPDDAVSHRVPGMAKTLLMSAAIRLATPSPAAQDDPAKGFRALLDDLVQELAPDQGNRGSKAFGLALAVEATATRQIAELRKAYAEQVRDHIATSAALKDAEADAAKVREERDAMARTIKSLTDPSIDHKAAKQRLMTIRQSLTQRGA